MSDVNNGETETPTGEQVTSALNVVEQALLAGASGGLGASDGTNVTTQIHKDVADVGGKSANTEDNPVHLAKKAKKANKKAGDEDEDEDEDGKEASNKKAKKAMDEDESEKKEIAALKASMSKLQSELIIEKARPLMTKMLTARANAGATQEQLNSFSRGMYGKSLEEIQQRYNEDSILINKMEEAVAPTPEMPSALTASVTNEIPWIETASANIGASGTLEEMLK